MQRCEQIFVVLLIAIGLFMFTFESTQFSLIGFILVLLASFLSGLRWTLSQIVLQKGEIGKCLLEWKEWVEGDGDKAGNTAS